jgi:primosomal protein N' (replication factor Y)
MLIITLKHASESTLNSAAQNFGLALKDVFKERVLGPDFPIIKKIQNLYLKEIKLKYEKSLSDTKVKERLSALLSEFYAQSAHKSVRVVIDVDPI